jgi:CBS domain-containing protein
MAMKTVKQLLQEKGLDIQSIRPDETVFDAMQLMAATNVGALLVMKDGNLVGLLTERDFSRKSYLLDKPVKDMLVNEIMTRQVAYVDPDYTLQDCMALVTEMRVRHLPVLENGRVIGIISIGDLVKDTILEHEFIINQLERYIYGTPE